MRFDKDTKETETPSSLVRKILQNISPEPIDNIETSITKTESISNENSIKDTSPVIDVLIVCALSEERDRVFDAFQVSIDDRNRTMNTFRSEYGILYHMFKYDTLTIAVVTQNYMGMASATSLTTRAILAMNPKLVVMTGICAGRKGKTGLGDIVIADQVYDYTAGKKYIDRFAPRPALFPLDDQLKSYFTANIVHKDEISDSILHEWRGHRIDKRITIHMNTLASGTAVIDDDLTMKSAAAIQDNLYAIDMEGYGVALAAVALGKKWIVIKTVQDFADGEKSSTEQGIRDFAAFASAALVKRIIKNVLE